jgi:hypothetical protein
MLNEAVLLRIDPMFQEERKEEYSSPAVDGFDTGL